MRSSAALIDAFLGSYRRRVLRLELWVGLLLWFSTLLVVGLVAWIGFSSGGELGWLRPVVWLAVFVGALVLFGRYGLLPRMQLKAGSVTLAREVERGLGPQRLEVASAVQLGRLYGHRRELEGLSLELIDAHLDRVAARLATDDPNRLVRIGRLRRPTWLLGFTLLSTAVVLGLRPQTYLNGVAALFHVPRQADGAVETAQPAWVGDIQLNYRYPAYTGRADRRSEGTDGTILALPGTQIEIVARADRPLAEGHLLVGDHSIPLNLRDAQVLSGALVVMEASSYRFSLVDRLDETWRSPRGHAIHLETDRPPAVRLVRPERDLEVRGQDAVELLYDARDDFGLDEIRLVWRIVGRGGQLERKLLRRLGGRGRRASRQAFRWELVELELKPGEQVQFYVEATDNDTILGPKPGRSATVNLKVFSAEAHHRGLMKQVQAMWERMLAVLADHLDQQPPAASGSARREDQRRLLTGLTELAEHAARLVGKLRRDQLAWRPLVDALRNIRQGLERQGDELGWMLRTRAARELVSTEVERRALASHRTRRVERLERDVLYLEDLLDLERLEDLERIAKELEAAQRRLAELMERYRNAPTDEVRRQIEAEIAGLKEQIAKLLARQSEVLKALRDEYLNPEALQRMLSRSDMLSALDRIQAMMMEGKVDQAMAELERLQSQLSRLRQAIDRSRSDFGAQRYRELAQAVSRIQGELNQIAEHQRRALEQTGELRDKVVERLKKMASADLEARLAELRQRLARLRRRAEQMDVEGMGPNVRGNRERVLEEAGDLGKLLEAGDLAHSLEVAGQLVGVAEQLRGSLDVMLRFDSGRRAKTFKRLARKVAEDAAQIHRQLRRMLPEGERLLRGGEPSLLGEMERRQRQLRRRLIQLRSQMRQLNQKAPLFGPPMLGALDRSGRSMGRATDELGRLDPRGAHPHQQAALSELERMQQAMRNSCRGGASGMPLPLGHAAGTGFGPDTGWAGTPNLERVEIPPADEYQPPAAFRKELLDGMKDPVPNDYQPQVRRYYEELVK